MQVTRQHVAEQLIDYLHHRRTLAELVTWAEQAMQEGEFDEQDFATIRDVVSYLGLADVSAFGLTWEQCEGFLQRLGYQARIEVTAAASPTRAAPAGG